MCRGTFFTRQIYSKNVVIDGRSIIAFINTGNDISLMRADEYANIGSPRFRSTDIRFSGIGSENIAAENIGSENIVRRISGRSYYRRLYLPDFDLSCF